jgi:hypothetical protein
MSRFGKKYEGRLLAHSSPSIIEVACPEAVVVIKKYTFAIGHSTATNATQL